MIAMKKIAFVIMLCSWVASATIAQNRETFEERKELRKLSKAELNSKATKAARKEAKQLQKDKWKPAIGALPLEKQLDRSYLMQMEYDEDMFPKYLMAERKSVAANYDAAKMQAMELAKLDLAGQIQTEVAALLESAVSNKQLEAGEAASVVKTVQESKARVQGNIGRVITVTEMYRTLKNKNTEVSVRIAYNSAMAKAAAKKAIEEDLEAQGEELRNKLDGILGW